MKIAVDHILDKPFLLNFEEPVDSFTLLAELQAEMDFCFTGPVRGEISAFREFDHVRVAGRVSVPVTLSCSRCLAAYDSVLENSFTIIFRKETGNHSPGSEVELGEDDLVSSSYSGDEIDLSHEIEELVAVEIPLKPLCADSCKGLCQQCGTDLNSTDCSCSSENISLKFSALKDFKPSR